MQEIFLINYILSIIHKLINFRKTSFYTNSFRNYFLEVARCFHMIMTFYTLAHEIVIVNFLNFHNKF